MQPHTLIFGIVWHGTNLRCLRNLFMVQIQPKVVLRVVQIWTKYNPKYNRPRHKYHRARKNQRVYVQYQVDSEAVLITNVHSNLQYHSLEGHVQYIRYWVMESVHCNASK